MGYKNEVLNHLISLIYRKKKAVFLHKRTKLLSLGKKGAENGVVVTH